ncbi:MAG TPA: hypothetical protein VNK43_05340 [Gemmatimonadales bacterium]|nr:hypothetical protein [Gemmatimonadales bacterium]
MAIRTVLLGFPGAPAAWIPHLVLSDFLVPRGRSTGWSGVELALAVASSSATLAGAAAAWPACRIWRRTRVERDDVDPDDVPGSDAMLMLTGASSPAPASSRCSWG